jgi:hypothetical protein
MSLSNKLELLRFSLKREYFYSCRTKRKMSLIVGSQKQNFFLSFPRSYNFDLRVLLITNWIWPFPLIIEEIIVISFASVVWYCESIMKLNELSLIWSKLRLAILILLNNFQLILAEIKYLNLITIYVFPIFLLLTIRNVNRNVLPFTINNKTKFPLN